AKPTPLDEVDKVDTAQLPGPHRPPRPLTQKSPPMPRSSSSRWLRRFLTDRWPPRPPPSRRKAASRSIFTESERAIGAAERPHSLPLVLARPHLLQHGEPRPFRIRNRERFRDRRRVEV